MIGWTGATERTEYLHVKCASHVLALVIKDAVKLYNKSIARIRSVVKYVTGSPARWEKFKHCCSLEKIDCNKGIILDCKTIWNSTFLMLEAAEKYERAFKRLEKYDRDYKKKYIFEEVHTDALPGHEALLVLASSMEYLTFSYSSSSESEMDVDTDPKGKNKMKKKKKKQRRHHAPYAEDWSYARSLVKCLKVFFDATVRFSAATQVITHTF
ncbi:zinc finger BED domain-containing protein DAYSLEEPER-like [Papaver somniferum]|uniref:zinc finger BED domain-containing protein DAYSLEEPER-like n=1 Tax=Papaver somniferum TaxID=3469 RepID=UPI000E6F4B75|nr:zinc finger BED domain-containing protein DAYSLEEPER-like [Papaver somniferum]XP_026447775.1 zinc finger BED domain-containing protein DAYSLEEPER-like [Papaver somniferum]